MKILSLVAIIIYCFSYTASVFAGCNAVSGDITIEGKDVTVPEDIPVGTLLDTFTISAFNSYHCDNVKNMTTGGKTYDEFATFMDDIRVYKTNITGIGYALGMESMCGRIHFMSKG
ncbi:MAG: hypothetical protein AB8W78_13100 [Arsenophonus endosymbiont of Dermacentor nuttalli]